MSGHDDIDVVETAENRSASLTPDNTGSETADNGAIRQNTPTDSAKPSLFERLKRAFSTDEDPDAEAEDHNEPFSDNDNLLSGLFDRLKAQKNSSDAHEEPVESNNETQTDTAQPSSPIEDNEKKVEVKETEINEEDPAEEEEFLMISAFLEGEEYVAAEKAERNVASEYDTQSAYEEEEAVFVIDEEDQEPQIYENNTENTTAGSAYESEAQSDVDSDNEKTAASEGEAAAADEAVSEKDGEAEASDKEDSVDTHSSDEQEADDSESEGSDSDKADEADIEENSGDTSDKAEADDQKEQQKDAEPDDTPEGQQQSENSEGDAPADDVESADSSSDEQSEAIIEENDGKQEKEADQAASEELTPELEDEEFIVEEDFLFDESDDEIADSTKSEGIDDFTELSTIFGEDEKDKTAAVDEKTPNTIEYRKELLSEPLESDASSQQVECESEPADSIETDSIDENKSDEQESEVQPEQSADDNESKASTPEAEAPQAQPQQETENTSAPEESVTSEKTDESSESAGENNNHKAETQPEQSETAETMQPSAETASSTENSSEVEKKISFFGKVKSKLIELWNTKEEAPAPINNGVVMDESQWFTEVSDDDEPKQPEQSESSAAEQTAAQQTEKAPSENTENSEETKLSENDKAASEENTDTQSVTDSETDTKAAEIPEDKPEEKSPAEDNTKNAPEVKTPQISIIKNDNAPRSNFDEEKLRAQLNVIERDDTDVLTDEQKQELEDNKRVLERVREIEEQTAAKREELKASALEREARAQAPTVTELEITNYRAQTQDFIKFSTGRFTDSVKSEYDCIINYKKMKSVSTKEALIEPTPDDDEPKEKKPTALPEIGQSEIAVLKEARDFERNHDRLDSICKKLDYQDERSPEPIEYRSEEDASEVRKYVTSKRRADSWAAGATLGITLASFIFACFARRFTVGAGAGSLPALQRIFAAVNLLLYVGAMFCCKDIIIDGLLPLKKFKANSNTGVAAAAAAAALQALLAIIFPQSFMGQGLNVYTLIVMLTLSVCCAGRYLNSDRISANFRFVSDSAQKYAGKFFPDQRMVAKLLSGTRNAKTELSFQKKTTFLKHFIRISKTEDPGDKIASSFALPSLILSFVIALVAGIMSRNFLDAWSVLCVMLCAGVPISSRVLASFPLHRLAKKSLMNKSMIVGYSAVETFSDSAAVMIDARDLYPEGSVRMNDFRALDTYRWQDGLYAAASVTIAAGGATAGMFDTMIDKAAKENLPTAEGVMYEDGKGLIGWVNNERVLVGNRQLLRAHGVAAPAKEEEAQFKTNGDELLYIAMSGQLVGLLIVGYTANHRVADVLKRMEASEMSLLVKTTDVNITAERIARDFGIGIKCIKVLEQKSSNVIRDEMVGKEKTSPAFIATKGGVTSFGLAVSECIQMKRNIMLSLAIEIVGALLKILVVTAIVLFAGIHHIGAIQLFLFSLFWIAAVICAPIIVQRMQSGAWFK